MLHQAVSLPGDILLRHNAEFTQQAWAAGLRPDQRLPHQVRPLSIKFFRGPVAKRLSALDFPISSQGGENDRHAFDTTALAYRQNSTHVRVHLGATHIIGSIHCHLVEPLPHQPKHGFIDIQVKHVAHERSCGPTAANDISVNPNIFPSSTLEIRNFLLRLMKGGVIDTEGLCVVPGKHVWSLNINLCIANNDGNTLDACELAALALLHGHRRPETLILAAGSNEVSEGVQLFEEWERDPVPLSLLHFPLSCSFAITTDPNETKQVDSQGCSAARLEVVADPTLEETAAAASSVTVVMNREGQVCALEKGGGPSVSARHILHCMALAGGNAEESDSAADQISLAMTVGGGVAQYWYNVLQEAVEQLDLERQTARRTQFQWAKSRAGVTSHNNTNRSAGRTPQDTDGARQEDTESSPSTKRHREE